MTLFRNLARSFRLAPIVSAVTILSLALGIGATSALFSVMNGLLLRPLPVRDPEQLAVVLAGTRDVSFWASSTWREIKARPELFDDAFVWEMAGADLSPGGVVERASAMWVSGGVFRVLGVPAAAGRLLDERDDVPGGGAIGPVAVLGYDFWQRRFGAGAAALLALVAASAAWFPARRAARLDPAVVLREQ